MNAPDSMFGERPVSTFYEVLCRDQVVQVAIDTAFGSKAQHILDGMRIGHVPPDQEDEVADLLLDLLAEKGEPAVEFVGRGDFGDFPITVMCFGSVFWVTAVEFDDIGFFGDIIAASGSAASNFEPLITYAIWESDQEY